MRKGYRSSKIAKKLLTMTLAVGMVLSCFPSSLFEVQAASVVGSLNGIDYTDFEDLIDDLEDDYKGKSVTIEMKKNWDANEDSDFNDRVIIPSNCRATLNMHGYVFDRCLSSKSGGWSFNGEIITMESGSTLTINGGTEKTRHSEPIYNTKAADSKADKWVDFYGGVLTGGSSTNGAGGIHIKDHCTLTLNDVTLAGCRAEVPWYDSAATRSGYGGGIWIKGEYSTVNLNRSSIIGNHAQEDGGGIFASNSDNIKLNLVQSHVDGNYSRSDGGGIGFDGEDCVIKGDGESTVSDNHTNGVGGGLYIWNDDVKVSGLIIEKNSAYAGGGIYTLEEGIELSDLTVRYNEASSLYSGGGIYIENDGNTIKNCVITDNRNGGVSVAGFVDSKFNINGKTIIKDNDGGNLMLANGTCKVLFALTRGADVHIDYKIMSGDFYTISPEMTSDARQFLTADDPDFEITYSFSDNLDVGRRLYYTRKGSESEKTGTAIQKAEKVYLSVEEAAPSFAGRVDAGGEKNENGDYALIKGYSHHEKTDSDTEDLDTLFYYSDGYFFADPTKYNDHLATTSLNLAFAGMYLRDGLLELDTYKYKHAAARQILADIGCPDQNIYVNDSNASKPGTDTIGVTIASKKLQKYNGDALEDTEYTLIPILVRGGGYELEWTSNMTLGAGTTKDGEAMGFSSAADQVMESLDYYIAKYELQDDLEAGKVKFWVEGYSRAGATSNITSKRIIEKYCYDKDGNPTGNQLFTYTCEAPQGGTDKAEKLADKTCYYSIHNLINASDIVPLVGPTEMGFKRYGVDHYLPGCNYTGEVVSEEAYSYGIANRSGESKATSVTTYRDNDIQYSKPSVKGDRSANYMDYVSRRNLMLVQLAAIDSSMSYSDYFHSKGFQVFPLTVGDSGAYEGSYREDFIKDFLAFFQQSSLSSRDKWATTVYQLDGVEYGTIQNAMRHSTQTVFSLDPETTTGIAESVTESLSLLDINLVIEIFMDVVGEWGELSDKEKLYYDNKIWDRLVDTGALDYLTDEQKNNLERDWPILADMIFCYVDGDWAAEIEDGYVYPSTKAWVVNPNGSYVMYTYTFGSFATSILANHYPEINLAWTRTHDSYYNDEDGKKEYIVDWGNNTVEAPDAYIDDTQLVPDDRTANSFTGDQSIVLEVGRVGDADPADNVIGEAIYYDLEDITSGDDKADLIEEKQIYRGGIDISIGDDYSRIYKLTTYARSYAVNSPVAVYYINSVNDKHLVKINTKKDSASGVVDVTTESICKEGDEVTAVATVPSDMIFKNWLITDGDENDVTSKLLTEGDEELKSISFKMPKAGEDGFDGAYALTVTAQYKDKISDVTIDIKHPEAGQLLSDDGVVAWGSDADSKDQFHAIWTYDDEGETVPVGDGSRTVYGDTVYTAYITVPQDEATDRLFASQVSCSLDPAAAAEQAYVESITTTKNSADGSITIKVVFKATEHADLERPDTDCKLIINTLDMNTGQPDPEIPLVKYSVMSDSTVDVTAPTIPNESFAGWDLGDSGVTIKDGSLTDKNVTFVIPEVAEGESTDFSITALYVPILNEVSVTVDEPELGQPLKTNATVVVKISNEYEVSPDNIQVIWTPTPKSKVAEHLVAYTATVKIVPKTEDGNAYIMVRPAGSTGEYQKTNAQFIAADNLVALFNGEYATYDAATLSISGTFDSIKYNLTGVKPVENPDSLPHRSTSEDVVNAIPKTTRIVLDDGREIVASIDWEDPVETAPADPLDESEWNATGKVKLPDTVENKDDISLDVFVTIKVREADSVSSPRASIESGEYVADQVVTLSSRTEGATIYYTTDGSDPTTASKEYAGEEIFVERDGAETVDNKFTIRAIAVKPGMRPSNESYYVYEFVNHMSAPKGYTSVYNFEEQIGVESGKFYTLEPASDGVTIDKNGNAVATNAGTYKVIAKAAPGFCWSITPEYFKSEDTVVDPDKRYYKQVMMDDEVTYTIVKPKGDDNPSEMGYYEVIDTTTEDQEIEFTIEKLDISELAEVTHRAKYDTREDLEDDIKIVVLEHILKDGDYSITYSKSFGSGVIITINGEGNFTGSIVDVVDILKPSVGDEARITYDPSGGVLRGGTDPVVVDAKVGDTITIIEAPERDGYNFLYWKGSEYQPGDSYVVVGDHTFTAEWEKKSDKGGDDDGKDDKGGSGGGKSDSGSKSSKKGISTGDNVKIGLFAVLGGLALAAIIVIIIIRKRRK